MPRYYLDFDGGKINVKADFFLEAKELAIKNGGKLSTDEVQKAFDIGKFHAYRLLDQLAGEGVIPFEFGIIPKKMPEDASFEEVVKEAREVINKSKKFSPSLVQRKLWISYSMASRAVETVSWRMLLETLEQNKYKL